MNLDLSPADRETLWKHLQNHVETFHANTAELEVAPELNQQQVQEYIHQSAQSIASPIEALEHVVEGMTRFAVHTPHPSYFGLFNPRAAFPGVVADTLTAAFNPQLAAWSHAPFAVEVENYLVREIGHRFGYERDSADGVFTTGGAEANLTAVQLALTRRFPEHLRNGLLGITKRPIIYTSSESHHSVVKAARVAGLGANSVKEITVDEQFRMNVSELSRQIEEDIEQGYESFMVVATGGTTGSGAIDPIEEIAELCQQYNLWLHLDTAYGGALVLEESTKHLLTGSGKTDSITFDAHKWLSMPMSTSLLLTRHPNLLSHTFGINTDYMPKDAAGMTVTDPFTHSIQWSRRFSGLKLYLTLRIVGWEGFAALVRQQIQLGNELRKMLTRSGWAIKNQTELPIICFTDLHREADPNFIPFVCQEVILSGQAWLSTYPMGNTMTLRACITNYATTQNDLAQLVELLNQIRNQYKS